MQRTEAGTAVAECEGLLPPKHDAGTATRHYRAFWQRRCRAAAAGAVLKPLGGNCAVLPQQTQPDFVLAKDPLFSLLSDAPQELAQIEIGKGEPGIRGGAGGTKKRMAYLQQTRTPL